MDIDKFKFFRKWFWVGLIVALYSVVAGLVYGIALMFEREHRKEGIIIAVIAIVWYIAIIIWVGPWLRNMGFFGYLANLK